MSTSQTALLVIDMQNDYCHPDGVFAQAGLRVRDLDELVGEVNTLAAAARSAGRPVIWVRMEWDGDADVGLLADRSPFLRTQGLRRGTWGSELLAGLDRAPDDHEVIKTRFDAFHRTGLRELLHDLDVGTLVVAGVRTDFCVESTVRQAFFHDLRVIVPREAVAGYVDDLHLGSLRLMGTVFAEVGSVSDAAAALAETVPAASP
ncbi:cysteine hydrolase [Actinomadura sp. KC06]|uniref:cysteine hydrolase family protein n=1 Tax=Actinomadura sp. KC06 TaxID=2530369 RepID=UPI00104EDF66|nr:isochorismatase family cysteine hydrolase [Actinomadura sp. KC06]TDD37516.1 cysteine hydrolase [Actinomadura sp. KC06]